MINKHHKSWPANHTKLAFTDFDENIWSHEIKVGACA